MKCAQPGCTGTVVDGYCDVCGLAPTGGAGSGSGPTYAGQSSASPVSLDGPSAVTGRSGTTRLGLVPLGSARSTGASRPTRRLTATTQTSRLGAGLTQVPSVPVTDPRQALMDPPMVAEDKRFCSVCGAQVGRSREGVPGRSKGFCPKCRTPFDFDPKLQPGALVGGQYEIVGCLAHGGMGWIYLANDRNVNDRWVVVKGLLNGGDPDASRAAVAEKQYLAEVEHPLIVEIYNFVTAADGASYIVMEYVGGRSLNNLLKDRMKATRPLLADPGRPGHRLHRRGPAGVLVPARAGPAVLRLQAGQHHPGRRRHEADRPRRRAPGRRRPVSDLRHGRVPGARGAGRRHIGRQRHVHRRPNAGRVDLRVQGLPEHASRPRCRRPNDVPIFAEHDSLYRWLLKGTAPQPEDRFQTAEEMRDQLLGVLSEVTAATHRGSGHPQHAVASVRHARRRRRSASIGSDLPDGRRDPLDPMAAWLASVTADDPADRLQALASAPEQTVGRCDGQRLRGAGERDQLQQASTIADTILGPIRGTGAACGCRASPRSMPATTPARSPRSTASTASCRASWRPSWRWPERASWPASRRSPPQMYAQCARTDAAYVAPAQFGLARLAAAAGRATRPWRLDHIPATSRAYGEPRRQRATAAVVDRRLG